MHDDLPQLSRIQLAALAAAHHAQLDHTPTAHALESVGLQDAPADDMVSGLIEIGVLTGKFCATGFYDVEVTAIGLQILDSIQPGCTAT